MKRSTQCAARAMFALAAIPVLAGCWTLEFSPDGSKALFLWGETNTDKSTLAVANVDGSGFRVIPGASEGMFGHWSPNGERISFANENGLQVYDVGAGRTTKALGGMCGDSAWIDDNRIVVNVDSNPFDPSQTKNGKPRLVWWDLAKRAPTQSIELLGGVTDVMFLRPIPRTEGALFISDNNLYLAEFGGLVPLTTTGDVMGFAIAADGNRVVYARRTKNAQYYLMSIYELNLKLRSGKRIANLQNVPGINPKPRTGPERIELVQFNNDFSEILVMAFSRRGAESTAKVYNELYLLKADGSGARKILGLSPTEDGVMAALAPDGRSIMALYGDKKSLTLARFDGPTGVKRVIRNLAQPKK